MRAIIAIAMTQAEAHADDTNCRRVAITHVSQNGLIIETADGDVWSVGAYSENALSEREAVKGWVNSKDILYCGGRYGDNYYRILVNPVTGDHVNVLGAG